MRIMIITLILFSICYGIDKNAGTAGYQFLKINFDSRSSSLGEISTGLFGFPADCGTNVSSMAFERNKAVFATVGILYADIKTGLIGGFVPINTNTRVGLFINFIDYGQMKKTDENGENIGEFSASSFLLGFGYARGLTKDIALGGRMNIIYEGIENYNSFGFSTDFSATIKLSRGRASAGLEIKNLGFQLKGFTSEHKDKLPVVVGIGGSTELTGLPFKLFAGVSKGIDEPMKFKIGMEIVELKPLYIRLGYTTREKTTLPAFKDDENLNGFSAGCGIELKREKINFDYAYSGFGPLGATHKFTLTYNGFR